MVLKEEFLFDFGINMPRILVSGNCAVIDNIKKIEMLTCEQIVVLNGKKYTAIFGKDLIVKSLSDERMLITGEVEKVEFY